jgi:hypothetical protein
MPDLIRFKVARAPERRVPADDSIVRPLDLSDVVAIATRFLDTEEEQQRHRANLPTAAGGQFNRLLQEALQLHVLPPAQRKSLAMVVELNPESVGQPNSLPLKSVIPALDRWLIARDDRPATDELTKELDRLASGILTRSSVGPNSRALEVISLDPELWGDRVRLMRMLSAMLIDDDPTNASWDARTRVVRLVLVAELIDTLAGMSAIPMPNEIFRLLRERAIALPERLLAPLRRKNPAMRRPGFADLFIVKDKWLRYDAGEIAHIQNVQARELREHVHQRLDEDETTVTTERTDAATTERDSQTTSRFELQTAAQEEFSIEAALETSVNVKATYGMVSIDAHVGGSVEASYSQSSSRAMTQARETITRALDRVYTAVTTARTRRTLSRVTETTTHTHDNKDKDEHVTAIYRWVDKIKRVEVWRYPNRYLVELHIPQPGAWLRWALAQKTTNPDMPPDPGAFTTLLPEQITFQDPELTTDYRRLGARYNARDLQTPPATLTTSTVILRNPTEGEKEDSVENIAIANHYYKEAGPTVPVGYVATTWSAKVTATDKGTPDRLGQDPRAQIVVHVGNDTSGQMLFQNGIVGWEYTGQVRGNAPPSGDVTFGQVPISVLGTYDFGYTIHVTITMEPTANKMTSWKLETYETLRDAWSEATQRFREAKSALETMSGPTFDAPPPGLSRQLVLNEMRRAAIEQLMDAEQFAGFSGYSVTPGTNEPSIDHGAAARHGPQVQFMEQAFEWSNLSWTLYPYYWAGRQPWMGVGGWRELALSSTSDPDFDAFLSAGAARLVVPARPGFEAQVQLFLDYGILWGGGPVPGPDEAGYLSVADEIRSLQVGAADGTMVGSWDVTLPTTLAVIDPDSKMPVKNPAYPLQ